MVYPKIILEDGKPKEVVLRLEDYEELLEQLEQVQDLRAIREMKDRDWETISLEDYLAGRNVDTGGRADSRGKADGVRQPI